MYVPLPHLSKDMFSSYSKKYQRLMKFKTSLLLQPHGSEMQILTWPHIVWLSNFPAKFHSIQHLKNVRSRQDSNLRGQSPMDF